ncbi:MAG: hypothetical protein ABJB11_12975 [Ferruginibacter sp.]
MLQFSAISQVANVSDENNLQLSVSPSINHQAVKDEKFSSVIYAGNIVGGAASLLFKKRNVSHEIKGLLISGTLAATDFVNEKLNQKVVNIDYTNLFLINSSATGPLELKLGGALQFQHNKRDFYNFINTNQSFETCLSLGAAVELDYSFQGNLSGVTIKNRITVPFLFSYVNSGYPDNSGTGSTAGKSGTGNFFSNNRIATIPKITRIRNNFEVEKMLSGQHFVALTYGWDYTKIGNTQRVIQAIHEIGILYRYIF